MYRGFDGGSASIFGSETSFSPEWHHEVSAIRALGERVVVIGRVRVRGKGSQAETESAFGYLIELQDGKANADSELP